LPFPLQKLRSPEAVIFLPCQDQVKGHTNASWFDPTNNTFSGMEGSPFGNTGTQDFTTPGNNGDGDPDWVLVLEST